VSRWYLLPRGLVQSSKGRFPHYLSAKSPTLHADVGHRTDFPKHLIGWSTLVAGLTISAHAFVFDNAHPYRGFTETIAPFIVALRSAAPKSTS
jgi:hypothetical protein